MTAYEHLHVVRDANSAHQKYRVPVYQVEGSYAPTDAEMNDVDDIGSERLAVVWRAAGLID